MAEAPEQLTSDPPTPPQDTKQKPKKNKRGRTKKPKRAAAAAAAPSSGTTMVEDPFLVLAGGKEGGFLELEEIDGADYGIFGSSIVEDMGASERKVGNDQKKKTKRGKRKRGDDAKRLDDDGDGDCAGDLVAESKEKESEKAEKKGKKKRRNMKKRKVNEKEKNSESKEDGTNDNVDEDKMDGTGDNVEEDNMDVTDDNVEDGKMDVTNDNVEEGKKDEKKGKKKRNRKKRKVNDEKKDSQSKEDVTDDNAEDMQDVNENMEQDNNCELKSGEDELYAWLQLRLHPLLIKAMHRLGFKEPTPIQKACFPAGAHQGKPTHWVKIRSIEALSKQAGMKPNAEIVDLTNASILPEKLEESFIECSEDAKDANLYYILSVHGQGRTIIFCTSIAALRHISSLLRILGINVLTNHAQMQQRARMKAVDRFRESENSILVATDGFARGMDFDNVRTVIHYQLPHSTDVYIHRSGRTARKSLSGCSIALIAPADKAKFYSLCKSFSKENLQQFPVDQAYMPAVMNRLSLARQIDKISRKDSQENANKSWLQRNAESMGLILDASDSEEECVRGHKQRKATTAKLQKLQQDLKELLQHPLQPKTFSRRYLAGAGISPLLQKQLEDLARRNVNGNSSNNENKGSRFVIIGQDRVEPLQALQDSGQEICVNMDKQKEKRRLAENWRRKKHEEKKSTREQKRKDRRQAKERD
uniref:Uncharacterized protein n=1 Tax=Avena sativa TaxID=4498 RepID=A0ACD5UD93_AVESA